MCVVVEKCYVGTIGIDLSTAPQSTPEQPSFAYAVGDVIAEKYALEELLGEGGMGAVFRARNTTIDMPVALKLIHPHLLRAPGFFKRFLREAQLGRSVVHDNVVRTLDADAVWADGQHRHFLVMEHV